MCKSSLTFYYTLFFLGQKAVYSKYINFVFDVLHYMNQLLWLTQVRWFSHRGSSSNYQLHRMCEWNLCLDLGLTGIPIFNTNNNCSSASCAIMLARLLVQSSEYRCVMALGEIFFMSIPLNFFAKCFAVKQNMLLTSIMVVLL